MGVIATEKLRKCYGARVGVDDLTLRVEEGALFGFLGPNGSGKTTTIRVLLGLLRPSAGSAKIFGLDCWREGHVIKRDVGYLPGDLRLYSWLTCRKALSIFSRVRRRDMMTTGLSLSDEFDLPPDLRVRAMSHGMRQKLGLILALAHRPRVVVLDEPTTALDPLMQEKLFERLRALTREGHTVFLSSHTLSEVERLCDHVAILRQGRMVADETLSALRTRAGRAVSIVWKPSAAPASIAPPSCLAVSDAADRRWEGLLAGPVMDFIQWCASQPIEDVSIGQPDLGAVFRSYYAGPEGEA